MSLRRHVWLLLRRRGIGRGLGDLWDIRESRSNQHLSSHSHLRPLQGLMLIEQNVLLRWVRTIIETSYRKFYRTLAKFPPKSGVSCRTSCSWLLRNKQLVSGSAITYCQPQYGIQEHREIPLGHQALSEPPAFIGIKHLDFWGSPSCSQKPRRAIQRKGSGRQKSQSSVLSPAPLV